MMLKVIRRPRPAVIVATAAMTLTVAVFAGLASAGSAFADHARGWDQPVTLNGGWAPLNRCPVDDPTMLAVDGISSQALCLADISPSGSMTIGNLTVAMKGSNHQFGVDQNEEGNPNIVVPPANGVLEDESVQLPGGIRELICPSHSRLAWRVCRGSHDRGWNGRADAVAWTLESAGTPYNFDVLGGLFPGIPFGSMPVKIHLQNKLLGDGCYIGSDAEPIVLQPMNLAEPLPVGVFKAIEPNGEPAPEEALGTLLDIEVHSSQGANSFAVPAASGCGFRGFLDQAIDNKLGLPSSASTNSVVFNEATSNLVAVAFPESIAPNDGKELAKAWHSAVLPPERGGHGGGHGHHDVGRHLSRDELEGYVRHWFGHRH
jgi:hypothetical protein